MVRQRSVRVFLRGGLGNQLFQYAAGLALSRKTKAELIIDTCLLPSSPHEKDGVFHRPEEISSFRHEGTIARSPETSFTRTQNFARLLQLERMTGDALGAPALRILRSVSSESRDLRDYFSNLSLPARINSYCSHPDFFSLIGIELRQQIYSLSKPSAFYLDHVGRLESEEPIGIHLRLGDYQNLRNLYGDLTADYFERALNFLSPKNDRRNLWVFSDEPEKAKEVLGRRFQDAYFVPDQTSSRPLESLILLSKLRLKVLSNSTFSWWSAYLGHPHQVGTVFPRPLFAKDGPKQTDGYLLEGWQQVDR